MFSLEKEMQSKNPLFNDFSKLVTGAFGIAQNAKSEMESVISSKMERWLSDRDFVNREEFEAVRTMAQKNAEKNAELLKLVSILEAKLEGIASKSSRRPRTKRD